MLTVVKNTLTAFIMRFDIYLKEHSETIDVKTFNSISRLVKGIISQLNRQ